MNKTIGYDIQITDMPTSKRFIKCPNYRAALEIYRRVMLKEIPEVTGKFLEVSSKRVTEGSL